MSIYVKDLPCCWKGLTLSQFLSHASGLPEYLNETNFRTLMPQDLGPRDIVAMAADLPLRFGVGERHEYNNLDFILLGMPMEAVTGIGTSSSVGSSHSQAWLRQSRGID